MNIFIIKEKHAFSSHTQMGLIFMTNWITLSSLFWNSCIWIEGEKIYLLVWKLFDLIKVNQSNLFWKKESPFARNANMHGFLYLFFFWKTTVLPFLNFTFFWILLNTDNLKGNIFDPLHSRQLKIKLHDLFAFWKTLLTVRSFRY